MVNNLLHAIAVLIAMIVGYLIGYPILFTLCAVWFFIGREIAQAEYRWIEHYGNGKRANMKWYAILEPRSWNVHSWFWNLLLPILVLLGVILWQKL
jgi:TRAP-type mannitol/chloroaromatic compound transport system permease large subunit